MYDWNHSFINLRGNLEANGVGEEEGDVLNIHWHRTFNDNRIRILEQDLSRKNDEITRLTAELDAAYSRLGEPLAANSPTAVEAS